MKKIVIKCWFVNSEDFIKEVIGDLDIQYELIDDFRRAIGLLSLNEEWILTGEVEDIDALVESLDDTDYDIEILDAEYDKGGMDEHYV